MRFFSQSAFLFICLSLAACSGDDGPTVDPNNSETDAGPGDAGNGLDASVAEDAGVDLQEPVPDATEDAAHDTGQDAAMDVGMTGYVDPAGESGTRLRRRYLEGGEGAYVTVDLWDTQMETVCSYREATDGMLRCLPDAAVELTYADAACSQPVYVARDYDCETPYARSLVDSAIYEQTDTPAVLSGALYVETSFGCEPYSFDPGAEHWVAKLVPSNQFVQGTVEDEVRADNMAARFIAGSDGSRWLQETVHRNRGYTCVFDEQFRCVPRVSHGIYYADAGCSEPLHSIRGDSVPPMLPDPVRDAENCLQRFDYFETGPNVFPTTIYYVDSDGSCMPRAASNQRTYYRRGAQIPLGSFPTASIALEGSSTLQARRYVDADGEPLGAAYAFWDTSRDEVCDPTELADDGSVVCLTRDRGFVSGVQFADSTCTEQISVEICQSSAPRLLADTGGRTCTVPSLFALHDVSERGAEVGGPEFYIQTSISSSCREETLDTRATAYRVGADALGQLPVLDLNTE